MCRLFTIILIGILPNLFAQSTPEDNTIFLNSDLPESDDFQNFLVQKTMNYFPEKEQYEREINIAKKEKNLANYDFLNNIRASGNLNEYTINPPASAAASNLFFPRYNFSVSFTLGSFFTQPLNKKIAKEEYFIKQSEEEVYNIHLKSEVLSRYVSFKTAKTIYLIQHKALDDAISKLTLNEDQFKNDQLSYEDYISSVTDVNKQKITTLLAQREYEIAKIKLEELIGAKIETVVQEYTASCK